MTYSGDPAASTTDAVRFLLNDTTNVVATEELTDTEIEWLLAETGNVYSASAMGARKLGAKYAGTADSKSVGPLSISRSGSSQRWYDLAKQLESKAKLGLAGVALQPFSGGISSADKETQESDTDWDKPWFKRELMDQPGGGGMDWVSES